MKLPQAAEQLLQQYDAIVRHRYNGVGASDDADLLPSLSTANAPAPLPPDEAARRIVAALSRTQVECFCTEVHQIFQNLATQQQRARGSSHEVAAAVPLRALLRLPKTSRHQPTSLYTKHTWGGSEGDYHMFGREPVATSEDEDEDRASDRSEELKNRAQFYGRASMAENHDGARYLNDYMIIKEIGRGASGTVLLAYSSSMNRSVALKIIVKPKERRYRLRRSASVEGSRVVSSGADSEAQEAPLTTAQRQEQALQREVHVMTNLHHKNIVALYEVINDPSSNKLYLIMQYVDRGPIATVDRDGCASQTYLPDALAKLAHQVCAGLSYLHRHGVVHRDIKPENILVSSDGCAYLTDFGVAEMLASEAGGNPKSSDTRSNYFAFQGTPLFMAPEMFVTTDDGSGADSPRITQPRALDIWALGVTFFTLLTGHIPFTSIPQIVATRETPLQLPTTLPKGWVRLLESMLQPDPPARADIRKVRAQLRRLLPPPDETALRFAPLTLANKSPCSAPSLQIAADNEAERDASSSLSNSGPPDGPYLPSVQWQRSRGVRSPRDAQGSALQGQVSLSSSFAVAADYDLTSSMTTPPLLTLKEERQQPEDRHKSRHAARSRLNPQSPRFPSLTGSTRALAEQNGVPSDQERSIRSTVKSSKGSLFLDAVREKIT